MIAVDASVVVAALADDGADGDTARDRLRGERLVAPQLLDLEVCSAWRRLARAHLLDEHRVRLAMADLRQLRLERVSHLPLIDRCWELRHSLTVYDAAYVAVAEVTGVHLVTADSKLAAVSGPWCQIELLR